MPIVTAAGYQTATPSVGPLETPGPDYQQISGVSPDAFGANVGRAQSQLGQQFEHTGNILEQNVLEQQRLTNQISADNATNHVMLEAQKILHGDPDKPGDVGYYGMKGFDAVNNRQAAMKNLTDLIDKTRTTSLSNPRQQLMFDRETQRMRNYWLGQIGQHYDQQLSVAQQHSSAAKVQLANQGAASASANGDMAGFSIFVEQAMNGSIEGIRARGGSQVEIDAALGNERAKATKMWVTDLATKDPLAADQFLESNKDALQPGEYSQLKHGLRVAAQKQQTERDTFGGPTPSTPAMVPGGAIRGRVTAEAQKQNFDPGLATAVAGIESRMGTNLGSRGNIFQLGRDEWTSVGGGTKGDPDTDIKNGITFLKNTKSALALRLGREPTPGEIYLGHQQGVAGATALLTHPNTPAGQLVPPGNISGNGGDPNAPASAFIKKWDDEIVRRMSQDGGGGPAAGAVALASTPVTAAQAADAAPGVAVQPLASEAAPAGLPDTIVRTLPPHEEGQLPDSEVPGLTGKIQQIYSNIKDAGPYRSVEERRAAAVAQARRQFNAEYADAQHRLRIQREMQQANDTQEEDKLLKRMGSNSQNYPTTQEIALNTNMSPAARMKMISFVERESKADPAAEVSKQNTMDMFRRMNLPEGNSDKISTEQPINDSFVNQKLTRADHDWLIKQSRDARTPGGETLKQARTDLINAVKPSILGPLGASDERLIEPENSMKLYNFIANMDATIGDYKEKGKNPLDLFNPKKPDFLGHDDAMKPYESELLRQIRGAKTTPTNPVPTAIAPMDITKVEDNDLIRSINTGKVDYSVGVKELERRGYAHKPKATPAEAPVR